ncbi:MAG: sigma-54-dependent transcriptional regulator [bacterium]
MRNSKILIIDDDKLVAWSISHDLRSDECDVTVAADGRSGVTAFRDNPPDIVLLDLKLPDIDGLEVLKRLKDEDSDVLVIMMTAYATVETAVQAVKIGAMDFIKKPFTYEELKVILKRALQSHRLSLEVAEMRHHLKKKYGVSNLIGESASMQQVFALIRKIAQSDATTVLIYGESGTGKDLVARAIHYESQRFQYPFMAMNCGSLPDTLLESELFGHEKGAFTDAKAAKKGLFELANNGTVLLDEIGDASPSLQVKLLRFIEEKSFKRIGGTKDLEVDVRIVAATNKDLKRLVEEDRFREDLYYRLKVIPVVLTPLRERPEDIPLLVKYLIDRFNKEFKKNFSGISSEALTTLKKYNWPGNVRELRNMLERIMILESDEIILPVHLPLEFTFKKESPPIIDDIQLPATGAALNGVEKALIEKALERTSGNQSRAAELLRISRHALRYKMKKYHLMN